MKQHVDTQDRRTARAGAQPGAGQKAIYRTPAGEQAIMAYYDRILTEWPDSTESLYVDTRHGRTHVLARGQKDAPPLVLLHGAGSNALAWGGDVPEFARHFRVYAVDTPGEPGRSCHGRISWKGEGIVEWLHDVVEGLNPSAPDAQTRLAGISQGAYIALRFATAKPERVQALALLAPGGVSPARPGFLVRGITYGVFGRRGIEALTRSVMGGGQIPQEATDFMNLIFTHFRSRMDAQPLITDAALRRLTMPVLLMAGTRDAIFDSSKTVARFERLVEGADVRLLPGEGHALIDVAETLVPFYMKTMADPVGV